MYSLEVRVKTGEAEVFSLDLPSELDSGTLVQLLEALSKTLGSQLPGEKH